MSMPLPGMQPQMATPPVRKTVLSHCSYTALLGNWSTWVCPGCGETFRPDSENR